MNIRSALIFAAIITLGIALWLKFPANKNTITEIPQTKQIVKLFYYNSSLDKDDKGVQLCSSKGLVGTERTLTSPQNPLEDTIKLLIKGDLSPEEKAQGLTTEFPLPGFVFLSANQSTNSVTLEFSDPQHKTTGGACRVNILRAQIEKTATQFSTVQSVNITPAELFQP